MIEGTSLPDIISSTKIVMSLAISRPSLTHSNMLIFSNLTLLAAYNFFPDPQSAIAYWAPWMKAVKSPIIEMKSLLLTSVTILLATPSKF
jgi:hypothetical protein